MEFEVYGISKIIFDIEYVNVESIVYLFRNVLKDEIVWFVGLVDVLIGYEYVVFYLERE